MRFSKSLALAIAALGLLSVPSMAGGHRHHRDHYRHHRGGPSWSIGIGLPLVPPPAYYGPYYYDAPAYYNRPVVVGREVGGDVVLDAQRTLARRGYYRGVIDGDIGPGTRAAIRAWQADCRLPITGRLDTATLRSLALI